MKLLIEKARRTLTVQDNGSVLLRCPIALGANPVGVKDREGDGRTPEGHYFVCLKKYGKYGFSLGVSYPNEQDAMRNGASEALLSCIRTRAAQGQRPPWGTFLGGEIYIHGGGTNGDWTQGCIAMRNEDVDVLGKYVKVGDKVEIKE